MHLDALVSAAPPRTAAAGGSAALEEVRIDVLGRKAPLVLALRELGALDPEERRTRGPALPRARRSLEELVERRSRELGEAELEERLRSDRLDVTLPGAVPPR